MWNVEGLFVDINKTKLCKLYDPAVIERVSSFDILALQEIQCGPSETQGLSVHGFCMLPFHRKMSANKRYFGGMMILIRKSLRKGIKIVDNFNSDKVWIKLDKMFFNFDKDLYINFTYASPLNSPYVKNLDYDLFQKLEEDIYHFSRLGNIILGGHLNAKTNTMNDYALDIDDLHSPVNDINLYIHDIPIKRENVDTHAADSHGKKLLEICKSCRVRILNGRTRGDGLGIFTRYPNAKRESPSTIDYFLSDCEIMNRVKSLTILPSFGISDHECLCLAINTKFSCNEATEKVQMTKLAVPKFVDSSLFLLRLKSVTGQEKLKNLMTQFKDVSCQEGINSMCEAFTSIISDFSEVKGPYRKRSKRRKNKEKRPPWYTLECRKVKHSLNSANKILRKKPFDKASQVNYINAKRKFKSICKKSERKFRLELTSKLLSAENKHPKQFWDIVKRMRSWGDAKSNTSNPIDPSEWETHFETLLNEESELTDKKRHELENLEQTPLFSELDFKITTAEVIRAGKRLNKKAMAGPDKISGSLLIEGLSELLPVIMQLFNKIFLHATIPDIWSLNFLVTIFKKGDNCDPNNYRGIAIGSCLSKLFSLILLDRIEKRIEVSNPISPNQIGFKSGCRTADHVFVIKALVNKIVNVEKKKLFVAFIDFRKAYDTVNRKLLLLKLLRLGTNGLFYRNIKASLNSISYLVKIKGGVLSPISSSLGLKQGGVLSPLLFNVFIDELGKIFDESCDPIKELKKTILHLLYADDLVIMSTSHTGLNKGLEKLKLFTDEWQLKVNMTKSQVIVFNPIGKMIDKNLSFKFGGVKMDIVKSYTYLGIELVASGSFRLAKQNLMDKARKAMFPLMSTIAQFHLPVPDSLKLFHAMIRPTALYNSENWGTFSRDIIKK